jgi:hypothetical protein
LKSGNSIFAPCSPYLDIIYSAAGETGRKSIPRTARSSSHVFISVQPIMIASIMMQESSCNKDTVGGGGEQGLMQITKDKCGGAPGGNCREPVCPSNVLSRRLA